MAFPPPTTSVVVGAGMIGRVHAQAIRAAGGTLRGVVGSDPGRAATLMHEWGATVSYRNFDAVLADDAVEVIHICTPNALHASQAMDALEAGKHVICEKPMVNSVDDAVRLQAQAERTGKVLAIPFIYRYHPLIREIRDRVADGEFGEWKLLHGSYLQDWLLSPRSTDWRVDARAGGRSRAFADIGSHWCDLVEWVAGVWFTEVTARMAIAYPERPTAENADWLAPVTTEDIAAVMLRTSDGVLGSLSVSQVSAGRKNRLWFELDGTTGSAVFDQETPETIWLGGVEVSRIVARDPNHGSAEQRRLGVLPAGHPQGYAECFRAFVSDAYAAMRGDAVIGLPTVADGLRSARLVEAVLHASDTLSWTTVGQPVQEELTA